MKRRGSVALVVALIIVVVLVVAGGVWYYKMQPRGTPSLSVDQALNPTSSIFITPSAGPAGAVITLYGTFSVCGSNTPKGECTGDRFNEPILLQNGNPIANSITAVFPSSDGTVVYQTSPSLTPGEYQFAIQNCLGKGCSDSPIGAFTVTPENSLIQPTINSVSPTSMTNLTAAITLYGSEFTATGNYVGVSAIDGNENPILVYLGEVSSADGKTITFQFPACYSATPPCGSFAYGLNHFAISNANGTSNLIPFELLAQPYVFQKSSTINTATVLTTVTTSSKNQSGINTSSWQTESIHFNPSSICWTIKYPPTLSPMGADGGESSDEEFVSSPALTPPVPGVTLAAVFNETYSSVATTQTFTTDSGLNGSIATNSSGNWRIFVQASEGGNNFVFVLNPYEISGQAPIYDLSTAEAMARSITLSCATSASPN